jgi:molecular chaperone GrpE
MIRKPKKTEKHNDSKAEAAEAEKTEAMIEQLQKEKEDLLGQLQRVSADYANFQKRVPRQVSDSAAYQKERVIKSLLPVLDNLEHTLLNAGSAEDVDVLVKGIQITHDQMLDILKSHDVEQIQALGEMFDPSRHEAMMRRSKPEREDNVVLEEFQKGYMLNGRAIRPSRVIVNKLAVEEPAEVEESGEGSDPQGTGECDGNDTE